MAPQRRLQARRLKVMLDATHQMRTTLSLDDDVLAAAKKRPLNVLLTPHLGYGSAAALAQAAGKSVPARGWLRLYLSWTRLAIS